MGPTFCVISRTQATETLGDDLGIAGEIIRDFVFASSSVVTDNPIVDRFVSPLGGSIRRRAKFPIT